jgi:putative acetyltransferase
MKRKDGPVAHVAPAVPEVTPLRFAQRELVRELGLMRDGCWDGGATLVQNHALIEVEREDGLTAGALAERLVIDRSTASRLVERLVNKGWVAAAPDPDDRRRKRLRLTVAGRRQVGRSHAHANSEASEALGLLLPEERQAILRGVRLYAKALRRRRLLSNAVIRPVRPADNAALREIIVAALAEYGVRGRPDPACDVDLEDAHAFYTRPRCCYFVAELPEGVVAGGAGYAPLPAPGVERGACELRKMYLSPVARGTGLGLLLLRKCLEAMRSDGYQWCYLSTLGRMAPAAHLYVTAGFERVELTRGAIAAGCDATYRMRLR